jgi:hypothetical protein
MSELEEPDYAGLRIVEEDGGFIAVDDHGIAVSHLCKSKAEAIAESNYHNAAYGTDLTREQWNGWTADQRQAWKDHGHDAWYRGDIEARILVPEIERPPMKGAAFDELVADIKAHIAQSSSLREDVRKSC